MVGGCRDNKPINIGDKTVTGFLAENVTMNNDNKDRQFETK